MSVYAKNTEVSSSKSRNEIEKTIARYGADQFMYGWQEEMAMIGFRMKSKMVRFLLKMPNRSDFELTETGRDRSKSAVDKAFEQSVRQRWRALALVVKAKLEAVESDITSFEKEFMAHIVLPNGKTVAEQFLPELENAYLTGEMPKMLPIPDRD